MNKQLSIDLYNRAREITLQDYGLIEPRLLIDNLIELVAKHCIYTIQMKILRDGSTPENLRSWQHVKDIAENFEIEVLI